MSKYSLEIENMVSDFLSPKIQYLSLEAAIIEETSVDSKKLNSIYSELEYLTAIYDYMKEYIYGEEEYTIEELNKIISLVTSTSDGLSITGYSPSRNVDIAEPGYSDEDKIKDDIISEDVSIIHGDEGEFNEKTGDTINGSFYYTLSSFTTKKNTSAITIDLFSYYTCEVKLSIVTDVGYSLLGEYDLNLTANTPIRHVFQLQKTPTTYGISIRYKATEDIYCKQINITTG